MIDLIRKSKSKSNVPIDRRNRIFEKNYKDYPSNLATLVNEFASSYESMGYTNTLELTRRIEINNLMSVSELIQCFYLNYYSGLDKLCENKNKIRCNFSFSIIQNIRKMYYSLLDEGKDSQVIFWYLVSAVMHFVENSRNYVKLSREELEARSCAVVIYVFIKGKIFNAELDTKERDDYEYQDEFLFFGSIILFSKERDDYEYQDECPDCDLFECYANCYDCEDKNKRRIKGE